MALVRILEQGLILLRNHEAPVSLISKALNQTPIALGTKDTCRESAEDSEEINPSHVPKATLILISYADE